MLLCIAACVYYYMSTLLFRECKYLLFVCDFMTVFRKNALLSNHSLLKLTLVHAAFVDSYPVHDRGGKLPVNRLLFVRGGDVRHDSRIRDPADGRTYPMRAGNLYFIPCNRPVDMDLAPDLQFLSLQFRLDLVYGFDVMEDCPHCAQLPVPELVDRKSTRLNSSHRI